jgi:hypothetical protein
VEHLLGKILEWVAADLDGRTQKTLRDLVPDFRRLCADPALALAKEPVVIGPAKRYATRLLVGFLVGAPVGLLTFTVLVATVVPVSHLHTAMMPISFCLAFRLIVCKMRGGKCILSLDGVAFHYHGIEVSCPWALFNVNGQPYALGEKKGMLLPIQPAAIPYVVQGRQSQQAVTVSGTAVTSPQFRFRSGNQVNLASFYEVDLNELGLLLQIGRRLGKSFPEALPPGMPFVENEGRIAPIPSTRNGWVTLSLTRLTFPPLCCYCCASTNRWHVFENLGQSERIRLSIPLCEDCKAFQQRGQRRSMRNGVGLGLLIGLACVADFSEFDPTVVAVSLGIAGAFVGGVIGHELGKTGTVKLKLDSQNGTIDIRVPNPKYAELLLAMQGLEE